MSACSDSKVKYGVQAISPALTLLGSPVLRTACSEFERVCPQNGTAVSRLRPYPERYLPLQDRFRSRGISCLKSGGCNSSSKARFNCLIPHLPHLPHCVVTTAVSQNQLLGERYRAPQTVRGASGEKTVHPNIPWVGCVSARAGYVPDLDAPAHAVWLEPSDQQDLL